MTREATLLAVTPGDPAGIGPECALRLAERHPDLPLLLVADPDLLRQTASRLGIKSAIREWREGDPVSAGDIHCHTVKLARPARPGVLDPANAHYVLDCLRQATTLVQKGLAGALVTGPVHKGIINDAGIPFSGHTEFLAELAGAERVVMMLVAGDLRVALVTTHLALREVPDAITPKNIDSALDIVHDDLRQRFAIPTPRIQVLGLNPHAGESGHLGKEDELVVKPSIARARARGIDAYGPVPADTAFTPVALADCDVVLAMYHDQGLPVLKHAGFGRAVNVTLGLPFIRTSVDHGTALDIAGQGVANPDSFYHAACLAQSLCRAGNP